MNKTGFIRLFFETNSAQLISNIIQLLASIIIARGLGPAGKGAFSATQAILEIVIYLFLFGFGRSILYAGSKYAERKSTVAFLASFYSFLTGVTASGVIVFLSLVQNAIVKNLNPIYLLIVAPVAVLAIIQSNFTYLLYSQEMYRQANIRNILANLILFLFYAILFVTGKMNVQSALFVTLAANIVSVTFYITVVNRKIGFKFNFDRSLMSEMLRLSLKSYFISLMAYIIVRSDLIILNSIKGNYQTGIYSIAAALAGKFLLIGSSVSSILSPRVIRDPSKNFAFILKVTRTLLVFMIVTVIIADLAYYPAVVLLYGKEFGKSLIPFLILNPGIIALCLNSSLFSYFTARGFPPVSIIAPFAAASLNIILNLILIPHYGYKAAALTSSVSYLLQLIITAVYIRIKENVSYREIFIPSFREIQELIERIFSAFNKIAFKRRENG